jgi:hypothetical protein
VIKLGGFGDYIEEEPPAPPEPEFDLRDEVTQLRRDVRYLTEMVEWFIRRDNRVATDFYYIKRCLREDADASR